MGKVTYVMVAAFLALLCLPTRAGEPGWLTDYGRALVEAKKQNRYLLIYFTSSDTSMFHKLFMKRVFRTTDFRKYAKKRLVLLYCDMPRSKYVPSATLKVTTQIRRMYKVKTVPSVVIISPKGQYVAQTRYRQGSAKDYLKYIHAIIKKDKDSNGSGSGNVADSNPGGTTGGGSDW